jgi:hypothetical protein
MRTFLAVVVLALLLLPTGCGELKKPSQKPRPQEGGGERQAQVNPGLAEKVKETAKTVKGVEDSAAVAIDNEISLAVKVKGFNRLRLKPIREEVSKKIREANKGCAVHVTSDKKLFAMLREMENQIKAQKAPPGEELWRRLQKINEDMQG